MCVCMIECICEIENVCVCVCVRVSRSVSQRVCVCEYVTGQKLYCLLTLTPHCRDGLVKVSAVRLSSETLREQIHKIST